MAARTGSAHWNGDLQTGDGTLTVGEDTFTGSYSFASRFEEGTGTNPEELIAAAQAACFSMWLSSALAKHNHEPESISTTAKVFLRNIDGKPTIERIELETEGRVPSIDEAHFIEHAEEAKNDCVISRALAGVQEVTLVARLAS